MKVIIIAIVFYMIILLSMLLKYIKYIKLLEQYSVKTMKDHYKLVTAFIFIWA